MEPAKSLISNCEMLDTHSKQLQWTIIALKSCDAHVATVGFDSEWMIAAGGADIHVYDGQRPWDIGQQKLG